jgi:hypothetical protein
MNKYSYYLYDNQKELLELLNFMWDNDMISSVEYDWWEDDETIQLKDKENLLTLAINDIENWLDDIYNDRDIADDDKIRQKRYLCCMQSIMNKHLRIIGVELGNE